MHLSGIYDLFHCDAYRKTANKVRNSGEKGFLCASYIFCVNATQIKINNELNKVALQQKIQNEQRQSERGWKVCEK